jgi:uncharacterized protein
MKLTKLVTEMLTNQVNEALAQLRNEYEITEDHNIKDGPCKMDGKPLYVAYFNSQDADNYHDGDDCTTVLELELELIPGLKEGIEFHGGKKKLYIWEDSQGFLYYDFVD